MTRTTSTCPAWCTAGHESDTPLTRYHHSDMLSPGWGAYASLTWMEMQVGDGGVRVYLSAGDGALCVSLREVPGVVALLEEFGARQAAALLEAAAALAEPVEPPAVLGGPAGDEAAAVVRGEAHPAAATDGGAS
ncbi:hypothetical protein [Actinomadura sp. SCN-SB]|uniref:hypothetical protein n=1 Tax=Actinomadura sp. SCN-SB TaxID=3373092 RepID=UPI0037513669